MSSVIKVDTISENTSANGVVIDGVTVKDGAIASSFISGLTSGLEAAQQFRLTANITSTGTNDITSNIEVPDTENQGNMGSLISESSGIFTFSETGFYAVIVQAAVHGTQPRVLTLATDDNSTYTEVGYAGQIADNDGAIGFSMVILDVTNTTNDKVKFQTHIHSNGGTVYGSTDSSRTSFTFLKLGDT